MVTKAPSERPEDGWHAARLIPAVGIKGQGEQEMRATSSLLAVMVAVPDFGREVLATFGAPAGRISTFTEVRLDDDDGKSLRPDGAIVVEHGKRRWSCLVEVKTGRADLQRDQTEGYLDIARAHGFDGLVTITNDIASDATELPVAIDQRKAKGLAVHHVSWWRILTAENSASSDRPCHRSALARSCRTAWRLPSRTFSPACGRVLWALPSLRGGNTDTGQSVLTSMMPPWGV